MVGFGLWALLPSPSGHEQAAEGQQCYRGGLRNFGDTEPEAAVLVRWVAAVASRRAQAVDVVGERPASRDATGDYTRAPRLERSSHRPDAYGRSERAVDASFVNTPPIAPAGVYLLPRGWGGF